MARGCRRARCHRVGTWRARALRSLSAVLGGPRSSHVKHGPTVVLILVSLAASAGLSTASRAQRPACPALAPLAGRPHPAAPGYIVVYHDSVDALAETARLAGRYDVSPRHLYRTAPPGFSAELEPEVLQALRCEPSVKWVEHNGVGCPAVVNPAIEVLVINAATDSADARGVTGVVRDGAYLDTLRVGSGPTGGPPHNVVAAFGRPGTYTVHLSKTGYHDWVQASVRARPGVCSVERAFVRAVMLPRDPSPRQGRRPEHRHP